MFPKLPPYEVPTKLVDELAGRMTEEDGAGLDHPDLPAGYTYFGQFLDHDLTFDPVSNLRWPNDPSRLEDFRTPRLDLDAVYGSGPRDMPYLYDQQAEPRDALLLIGNSRAEFGTSFAAQDLPRNVQGQALIGDPRDDENTIIAQLHLVFLKFHNRVARALHDGGYAGHWPGDPTQLFWEAQRIVRWHYQWLVLWDFLPRILPAGLIEDLLGRPSGSRRTARAGTRARPGQRLLKFGDEPFMPVEFSVGAYRFGHSLVRPSYQLNARATNVRLFAAHPDPLDAGHLGGFRPLLDRLVVDWDRFLDLTDRGPQRARWLDAKLAAPLASLPAGVAPPGESGRSLAWLNLMRGRAMGLPSGQDVAGALGAPPLTDHDLELGGAAAPLWYYILVEAATRGDKRRLGAVGGRIVAEVILGLLEVDRQSFLGADPAWTPFLGNEPGRFTLADLVRYATESW